jgi:transposase
VRAAREAWFGRFAGVRLGQLVLLDEFGATTAMQRTHGRAPPGERVVAAVPHGHWKVISTVAAMTVRGIVASASYDSATDTELFVAFVREALVPALVPGQVVVMDNLAPHKVPEVARLVGSAGARVLLLPPYSPDFNPIEQAFSKVKAYLRTLASRTVPGLFDGIGEALSTVTPDDAAAYITNSGYVLR